MLKDNSVDPTGMKVEALLGFVIAQGVMGDNGHAAIITSINDATHSPKSRHHIGLAFDLRSRNIQSAGGSKEVVLRELKDALPGYDVLLEGRGTPNEHFHIEYDPRRP